MLWPRACALAKTIIKVKKIDHAHHAPKVEVVKTARKIETETKWESINLHVLVEMLYGMETFIFPRCQDVDVANNCHCNNQFMAHDDIKRLLLLVGDGGYSEQVLEFLCSMIDHLLEGRPS